MLTSRASIKEPKVRKYVLADQEYCMLQTCGNNDPVLRHLNESNCNVWLPLTSPTGYLCHAHGVMALLIPGIWCRMEDPLRESSCKSFPHNVRQPRLLDFL